MSTIKFRAYVPETNEYYYPNDTHQYDPEKEINYFFDLGSTGEVEFRQINQFNENLPSEKHPSAIIQLWSGKKDMDGDEIYDGDTLNILSGIDKSVAFKLYVRFGSWILNHQEMNGFYCLDDYGDNYSLFALKAKFVKIDRNGKT